MTDEHRGELVVISTPIGNLGDLSERAKALLGSVDLLCCEDTRTTGRLCSLVGVSPPKLLSLHEHNEHDRLDEVLERLEGGATVGLVCDAGTPLVSDPGAKLVAAATEAGVRVTAAPGASAALAALVVAGFGVRRFRFEGFLPKKGGERDVRLQAIATSDEPTIIYEAPSRVGATVADLLGVCGPDRAVAISRELTKLHEETWRGMLGDAGSGPAVTAARGEYVLVIDGAAPAAEDEASLDERIARLAAAGLRRRDAVAAIQALFGVTHRVAYEAALAHRGFVSDS